MYAPNKLKKPTSDYRS